MVLSVEEYGRLLEAPEDAEAMRETDEAPAETENELSFGREARLDAPQGIQEPPV